MKYHFVFSIILLLELLFTLNAAQVENNESQLLNDKTNSCDPDLPYMSVGDIYLTEDNFTKLRDFLSVIYSSLGLSCPLDQLLL